MCVRVDVALSRQAVFEAIRRRMESGEPVTLEAIAEDIRCSARTVSRAIHDLKHTNRIKVIQRGTRYVATEYEIVDSGRDAPTGSEQ